MLSALHKSPLGRVAADLIVKYQNAIVPADSPKNKSPSDIAFNIVRALTLYSLAEFQSGHASTIKIAAEGRSFSVADNGRGHSIDRMVDGISYLDLVYKHFDYPFGTAHGTTVQLQGIGMSLINSLCSELVVAVQKPEKALRLTFRDGSSVSSELLMIDHAEAGIAISGTVKSELQISPVDSSQIRNWLVDLLAANTSLNLLFNGQILSTPADT